MDKPWLKSYPEGVSSNIKFDEFSSLIDMFDKTCDRFSQNPSFTNFGKSLTFYQLKLNAELLASFLSNNLNLKKLGRMEIWIQKELKILKFPQRG